MLGVGEFLFTAYAIRLGYSDLLAGILATAPIAIAGFVQLLVPRIINQVRSYKKWCFLLAFTQACLYLFLAFNKNILKENYSLLFGTITFYWIFALSIPPVWNAWISQLFEQQDLRHLLVRRNYFSAFGSLLGLIIGGFVLSQNKSIDSFMLLFLGAALLRTSSSLLFFFHPSIPYKKLSSAKVTSFIKNNQELSYIKKFTRFTVFFKFGVFISSAFFTPYMLKSLGFTYYQYTSILLVTFIGRFISTFFLQKFIRHLNLVKLYFLAALTISFIPLIWVNFPLFSILIFTELITGLAWGCYELCFSIITFEKVSSDHQTSFMSYFNFWHTIYISVGCVLGAFIFYKMEISPLNYNCVFILSSLARLLSLMIFPIHENILLGKKYQKWAQNFIIRPGLNSLGKPFSNIRKKD